MAFGEIVELVVDCNLSDGHGTRTLVGVDSSLAGGG